MSVVPLLGDGGSFLLCSPWNGVVGSSSLFLSLPLSFKVGGPSVPICTFWLFVIEVSWFSSFSELRSYTVNDGLSPHTFAP